MSSDNTMFSFIFTACFTIIILLTGCDALKIVNLVVPDFVRNGTDTPIVLDCDYELPEKGNHEGLMVKWYLNDKTKPIYQWIVGKKPHALGVLKNKVNLEFKASQEPSEMYRGIQIINPTVDMSGDYICFVSTYFDEEQKQKKMVVYVPGSDMRLTATKVDDEVIVKCSKEGVFPEPNMTLTSNRDDRPKVDIEISTKDGVYDIVATMSLNIQELTSTTEFDCVLRINNTDYTVRRSTVYSPEGSANGSSVTSPSIAALLLSYLVFRL